MAKAAASSQIEAVTDHVETSDQVVDSTKTAQALSSLAGRSSAAAAAAAADEGDMSITISAEDVSTIMGALDVTKVRAARDTAVTAAVRLFTNITNEALKATAERRN